MRTRMIHSLAGVLLILASLIGSGAGLIPAAAAPPAASPAAAPDTGCTVHSMPRRTSVRFQPVSIRSNTKTSSLCGSGAGWCYGFVEWRGAASNTASLPSTTR